MVRVTSLVIVGVLFSCQTIFGSDNFVIPKKYEHLLTISRNLSCTQMLLNRKYSDLSNRFSENSPLWEYIKWNEVYRETTASNYFLENPDKTVSETISYFKTLKWKLRETLLVFLEERSLSFAVQKQMQDFAEVLGEEFSVSYKPIYNTMLNESFLYDPANQKDYILVSAQLEVELSILKGIVGELLVGITIKAPTAFGQKVRDILSPSQKDILKSYIKTKDQYETILNLEIDVIHGNGLRWLEVKNCRSKYCNKKVDKLVRRHALLRLVAEAFEAFGESPLTLEYVFLNTGARLKLIDELTKRGAHIYLPE